MAGPGDPPVASRLNREPSNRRRSSVAYDPARDTFKELPDGSTEHAVDDRGSEKLTSSPAPAQRRVPSRNMDSIEDSRKRSRSRSIGVRKRTDDDMQEQPERKKRKPSFDEPSNHRAAERSQGYHRSDPRPARNQPNNSRAPRPAHEGARSEADPRHTQSPHTERRQHGYRAREGERTANYSDRRRSRSPPPRRQDRDRDLYRRRSPPRPQRRDPSRSPSPIRSPPRAGPVVRPGGAKGRGRNVLAEQQRLAAEREAKQAQQPTSHNRGVQDVSNQFYNARPEWVKERGREWRKNESQIKGLRSFNNWVKSCLIQKFSPEDKTAAQEEELGWGEQAKEPEETKPLLVLDVGCGKGGDLGKWQLAPQAIGLYVGLDPASTSITQARERYTEMRRGRRPIFDARFQTQDCFGEWIGNVPIIREVGIDPNAGSGQIARWGDKGGFDIVTMMFTMHYAFESEDRVKMMLRNAAGCLKKGGRLVGVSPNSDVLATRIREWYSKHPDQAPKPDTEGNLIPAQTPAALKEEGENDDNTPSWGNKIYNIRFPPQANASMVLSPDGTFRPPFGWKYTYWMAEAVDVPEFVVPWEAFRAIAEQFGLEQRYRRGFLDVWEAETKGNDPIARELSSLGVRMGVTRHEGGDLLMSDAEKEAVNFYHAFCFVKI